MFDFKKLFNDDSDYSKEISDKMRKIGQKHTIEIFDEVDKLTGDLIHARHAMSTYCIAQMAATFLILSIEELRMNDENALKYISDWESMMKHFMLVIKKAKLQKEQATKH